MTGANTSRLLMSGFKIFDVESYSASFVRVREVLGWGWYGMNITFMAQAGFDPSTFPVPDMPHTPTPQFSYPPSPPPNTGGQNSQDSRVTEGGEEGPSATSSDPGPNPDPDSGSGQRKPLTLGLALGLGLPLAVVLGCVGLAVMHHRRRGSKQRSKSQTAAANLELLLEDGDVTASCGAPGHVSRHICCC